MQIEKFFETISGILLHQNIKSINAPITTITPLAFNNEGPLPPIVHCTKDYEELAAICRDFNLEDPVNPKLDRYQMIYRYLSAISYAILREQFPANEYMAFIPTNPLTILHTPGITREQLNRYCIQLADIANEHQSLLLKPWNLHFLDHEFAQLRHENLEILLEVLDHLAHNDDEDNCLNYAFDSNPLTPTQACIDIDKAKKSLLKRCEIKIQDNGQLATGLRLNQLCTNFENDEHSEIKTLLKLTRAILQRDNFDQNIDQIKTICSRLRAENALSIALMSTIEAYLIVRDRTLTQTVPDEPDGCDDRAIETLLDDHICPCMSTSATLPKNNTAFQDPTYSFIRNQLLRIDTIESELKTLSSTIEKQKNISSYEHPVTIHLTPYVNTITRMLFTHMMYQECITITQGLITVINSLNKKSSSSLTKIELTDSLIFTYEHLARSLLYVGEVKECSAALSHMIAAIQQGNHFRAEQKFTFLYKHKKISLELAILNSDIDEALKQHSELQQWINNTKNWVIPKFEIYVERGNTINQQKTFRPVIHFLEELQQSQIDLNVTQYYICLHYYFTGEIDKAVALLDKNLKNPTPLKSDDFSAIITRHFKKKGLNGVNFNLSKVNDDEAQSIHNLFMTLKATIGNGIFLECLSIFYAIEQQNTNIKIQYDFSGNQVTLNLNKNQKTVLEKSFHKHCISFKYANSSQKNHQIVLKDFENIDTYQLALALRSIFSIKDLPEKVKIAIAKTPNNTDIRHLRFRAFKDMTKTNFVQLQWHLDFAKELCQQKEQTKNHGYLELFQLTLHCMQAQRFHAEFGHISSNNKLKEAKKHLANLKKSSDSSSKALTPIGQQKLTWTKLILKHTTSMGEAMSTGKELKELIRTCPITEGSILKGKNRQTVTQTFEKIHRLYRQVQPKIKGITLGVKYNMTHQKVEMSQWLAVAAGELYLSNIGNPATLADDTTRMRQVYESKMIEPSDQNSLSAGYYSLCRMLATWESLSQKEQSSNLSLTKSMIKKNLSPDMFCRYLNLEFILQTQQKVISLRDLASTIQALSELYDQNSELHDMIKPFYHQSILPTLLHVIGNGQYNIKQQKPLIKSVTTFTDIFSKKDPSLYTLMAVIHETFEYFLTHINLSDTELDANVMQCYSKLHTCLVKLCQGLDTLEKNEYNSPHQHSKNLKILLTNHLNRGYELIAKEILPKYFQNGRLLNCQKTPIDPYNWYCLVKYDYFPTNDSKTILTVLEKCHDIDHYRSFSNEDLVVLLACLANEKNNMNLLYSIACCYLSLQKQSEKGIDFMESAHDHGHPFASYGLGKIYWFGLASQPEDRKYAALLFEEASKKHKLYKANYRLARHYQDQGDIEQMKKFGRKAFKQCPHDEDTRQRIAIRFQLEFKQNAFENGESTATLNVSK